MHVSVNSFCPTDAENYSKTGTGKQHTGLKAKKDLSPVSPYSPAVVLGCRDRSRNNIWGKSSLPQSGAVSSLFSLRLEGD